MTSERKRFMEAASRELRIYARSGITPSPEFILGVADLIDTLPASAPDGDLRERIAVLEEALRPFALFAEVWDGGTRGHHDELYAIQHTKGRAVLRLSDCGLAAALLRRTP